MLMQGLTVSSLITHLQIKKTPSPNEFPIKKKSPSIQINPLTYLSSEKFRFWWRIFLTKSLKPTSATWHGNIYTPRGKTCTDLISMVKSFGRKRWCTSGALIWNSDLDRAAYKTHFMRNSKYITHCAGPATLTEVSEHALIHSNWDKLSKRRCALQQLLSMPKHLS